LPHDTPTPYPWTGIVFGLGIVLSTAYFVGNQAVVQRALGARSEWDAKAGMILAGFLKLFIPFLVVVPGLAATALHPDLDLADRAVPTLIRDLLPPGLTGLMFAAFFAALMSSVDSYLNSSTTVLISDLYGKAYRLLSGDDMSARHGLMLGRLFTAGLIVAAGLVAPLIDRFETVYVAIQTLFSIFQGPTLAILLLGILWHRTTRWGALAGLVLGVMLTTTLTALGDAVFPSDDPFLFVSLWSFVFSLAVTAVVSLLTPAEPPEKIRGLVFRQVLRDEEAQRLLRRRVDRS
jgi:SSS family solute:Na+ symporter